MKHDVVVLGGGSAGYAAASEAHRLGADVALADPGPLGGLCILRGCMPTKAMLRSAEVAALVRSAGRFGVVTGRPRPSLPLVVARRQRLVEEFAEYRIGQLRDGRFRLYESAARFVSPHEVRVGRTTLTAGRIIIATGSTPASLAVPGLEAAGFLTSDTALELRRLPPRMVVLGGGPVALELAQLFQRLGSRVTLIQRSAHVLSHGDEDLARPLEARLRAEGMRVYTGTRLLAVTAGLGGRKAVRFRHGDRTRTAQADELLVCTGRQPAIGGLGLEAAGVRVERGRIAVDAQMRTSQPWIFAVGDVNGLHEVVHSAIEQGQIAAHNAAAAGLAPRRLDDRLNMQVTFTDPQVASVGLSERECRDRGVAYLTAAYPFSEHGKALCRGETDGHVKILCDPATGQILGGHIVGPEAGELLHELAAVMYFRGTVRDLAAIPHYHPTLAEILTYPAEELADQLSQ